MKQSFIRSIGDLLNVKDLFLYAHCRRVSGFAVAVGHRLDLNAAELEQLSLAAFLHAVGQIALPDRVSRKTSPLTVGELQIKKRCAERAAQMLASVPEMSEIARAVGSHAECFDGSGFPKNLAGEQIPLFSRIIAVAQAYDEMTEPCGGEASTHGEAIENLRMRIACKITDTAPEQKTASMNTIESGVLEFLNLSRADLNKIYDRATFISAGRVETPAEAYELIH